MQSRIVHINQVCEEFLVWNSDDAAYLNDELKIVGKLIGAFPRFPRQNNILGLPMQLMPEEVYCLIKIGAAMIVKMDEMAESKSAESRLKQYHISKTENYKEQVALFMEERKSEILKNLSKIIEGKKRKIQQLTQTNKEEGALETEDNHTDTFDKTCSNISPIDESSSLLQLFTDCPWARECACGVEWSPNFSSKEQIRANVFEDLNSKGYPMTSGSKFGGDFLIYPGDPARFHSHFIAFCLQFEEKMTALDFVAFGRSASNVRKTALLCSLNSANVCYTSIQWTGIC